MIARTWAAASMVGDVVTSGVGWREVFIAPPQALHPVSRDIQPLSAYLGALGMTGMTAWAGLNLVDVKAGAEGLERGFERGRSASPRCDRECPTKLRHRLLEGQNAPTPDG